MTLEFQCPHCGFTMQAETGGEGGIAQCPSCSQQFMVDASQLQMPVAKAKLAGTPAPKPAPMPVGRPPGAPTYGGPARSHAAPGQHSAPPRTAAQRQAAERAEESKGKLLVVTLLVGGSLLLFGLIRLAASMSKPDAETTSTTPPLSKAELVVNEVAKAKTSTAAQKEAEQELARKQSDEMRQREQEAEDLKKKGEHDRLVTLLTNGLLEGDRAAGEAMASIVERAQADLVARFEDNIPGNEPRTEKEVQEFLTTRIIGGMAAAPLLTRWSKDHGDEIAALLVGGPRSGGGKGKESMVPKVLTGGNYVGFGTGFYVSEGGVVVTNAHVVHKATKVDLRHVDGRVDQATVLKVDEKNDIALLKASGSSPAWLSVSTGEKEPGLGHSVFTIGFPQPMAQGIEPKYTDGKISAQSGFHDSKSEFQISVPIQPGNSGGPLVDSASGWVVGIVAASLSKDRTQNVNYAVKGRLLYTLLSGLPEFATPSKALPAIKPGDVQAITDRVKSSVVLIMVPGDDK